MDWDDIEPKKKPVISVGDDLSGVSLEELSQRIEALEGEITRIKTEINAKQSTKNAAEDIFKG